MRHRTILFKPPQKSVDLAVTESKIKQMIELQITTEHCLDIDP